MRNRSLLHASLLPLVFAGMPSSTPQKESDEKPDPMPEPQSWKDDDAAVMELKYEDRQIPDSWYRDLGNSFAAQSGYTNNPGYRGSRTGKRPKAEKRARQLKRRNTKRNKR